MRKSWKEDDQVLLDHYEEKGMQYCCEVLDRSQNAILHRANRLGLKRKGDGRKSRLYKDPNGYWVLSFPNLSKKGKKLKYHRFIMMLRLKRPLKSNEIVHHKDEDKDNNHWSNLELHTRSTHMKHHDEIRGRDSKGRFKPN